MKKKISFNHLILTILFVLGLNIAKDFGISWDEGHHRDSGQRIVVYLLNFFGLENIKPIPPRLQNFDYLKRMYGPIFDTISAVIEEIFQINDMKNVFTMRHYLNFIFYFTGYLGYFYLIKILFPKSNYAILFSFFYLFHPRLFGQGFFNPKDSILQVYVSISLIPIIRSFLYFKFKDLFFSSIAIGIAISTKVVAIYIPLLFSVFYLIIGYFENISIKSIIKNLSLFHLSPFVFYFYFLASLDQSYKKYY